MAFLRITAGSCGKKRAALPRLAACLLAGAGLLPASHAATTLPPGARPCITNALPPGYGSLLILQTASFEQTGELVPSASTNPAPSLSAELTSPDVFVISNALLANTRGFSLDLPYQSAGVSAGATNFSSEEALLAAASPGAWNSSFQLVFTNGDSFVGFSVFQLASNTAPIPQVANHTAAQSINPAAAFNLNWLPWIGTSTNDRIALVIRDAAGNSLVSAATDCAGQSSLPVGATGFSIPAGTLSPATEYTGHLTFGASLLSAQDDGAFLAHRGFHSRSTRFTLRTASGGGTGESGVLSRPSLTATSLVFTLTGTPGTTYSVQSGTDLVTWTEQSRVTLPPSGSAEVTLPLPASGTTQFYRALSVGGGPPPSSGATLSIAASSPTRMRITITGAPGSSHIIQATTNWVTWTDLGTLAILEGESNVVFTTAVPPGSVSTIYRALAADGTTPPPPGKRPTLTAAAAASGLLLQLTGGDANRTYDVQTTSAAWPGWTSAGTSLTTGADGNGQATLPFGTATSGFYRVQAR